MTNLPQAQPKDGNGATIEATSWDPTNHQFTMRQSGPGIADTSNPQINYAPDLVSLAPGGNTGIPANIPAIIQKNSGASTGSVSSLAVAFTSNNDPLVTKRRTIVVVCGAGSNGTLSVTDTLGNTYLSAVSGANSTTFEAQIFYAVGILSGANTVTIATTSASSIAAQIYEVDGLVQPIGALGQNSSGSGTGTTASTSNLSASSPNSLIFLGVAVGTTAEAITAVSGTNWTVDSSQNTTTPSGLYSFGALSLALDSIVPVTPQATIAASKPWAAVAAIFKPVVLGIQGQVHIAGYTPTIITTQTTTIAKTGPGTLRQIVIMTPVASAVVQGYDNTAASGSKLFPDMTLPATLLNDGPLVVPLDAAFNTGCTIVTSGATMGVGVYTR